MLIAVGKLDKKKLYVECCPLIKMFYVLDLELIENALIFINLVGSLNYFFKGSES